MGRTAKYGGVAERGWGTKKRPSLHPSNAGLGRWEGRSKACPPTWAYPGEAELGAGSANCRNVQDVMQTNVEYQGRYDTAQSNAANRLPWE